MSAAASTANPWIQKPNPIPSATEKQISKTSMEGEGDVNFTVNSGNCTMSNCRFGQWS
ncbi:hypothetical protein SAMN05428948_0879 [Massilia sp. CF038]|nr:hypothetical protein SAMN05428948_0879 [Massilia sp. CF038]